MNLTHAGKTFNLIRSMIDMGKPTVAQIRYTDKKPLPKRLDEVYFKRVTPEECGIDSALVYDYVNSLYRHRGIALQSIVMMRNGKVFFEGETGAQNANIPKATFSECKSIVSLAIGVLVTQGKLKINELITDVFSDRLLPVSKIRLRGLTVKHLLTMTSCVTFNESESIVTEDWIKAYLNSDTEGEFGKTFRYNSLNTYMLSVLINERTGMSLSEFLDRTIFGELGIVDYYWEKCPSGYEKGGWGLYIRREDMLKLGYLVACKGKWNGKRLISEKYIEDAVKTQSVPPAEYGGFDYGFHIWTARDGGSFLFNGMLGQNLIGFWQNGIVIAVNCGNADTFQQGDFFKITDRYFNREFSAAVQSIDEDKTRLNELKQQLRTKPSFSSILKIQENCRNIEQDILALDGKRFVPDSENAASSGIAPIFLQTIQATYTGGLSEINFSREGNTLIAEFVEQEETHRIRVGFEKAVENVVYFDGNAYIVYAKGEFTDTEDRVPVLKIDLEYVETPYTRNLKFVFDSDEISLTLSESPGYMMALNRTARTFLFGPNINRFEDVITKIDADYFALKFAKVFMPRVVLKEIK